MQRSRSYHKCNSMSSPFVPNAVKEPKVHTEDRDRVLQTAASHIKMIRLNRRQKPFVYVAAIVVILWGWKYWMSEEPDWEILPDNEVDRVLKDPNFKHDKWIVVTTIQRPTDALKTLAQIPGWKLIVVGDRRTPKGWSLPNTIYLDVKTQKALGYKIHQWLPYDSYTRKAIGYLYAIEHGAIYIYETDDDNSPLDAPDSFINSLSTYNGLLIDTKNLTYNPYVHFGQSTVWPRGFPLDHVGNTQPRKYKTCTMHAAAIQQGLVNGDPDVDAIFRMTRRNAVKPLDLRFDGAAPPVVLPQGTMAPFNSQNTLFTAKAFWAMVLPITVSMRATDIYRSYWAQRLLSLVGSNVAFFPPNSIQRRNPHSDHMDSIEENELYHYMGQYIDFLHSWTCSKLFFFDCISSLTEDLIAGGFLKRRDADLVTAWITDLATIGYAPPALKDTKACHNTPQEFSFYPTEQNTTLPHSLHGHIPSDVTNHQLVSDALVETCGFEYKAYYELSQKKAVRIEDTLLIISLRENGINAIPFLESIYQTQYPHRLYCGNDKVDPILIDKWKVSYVHTKNKAGATVCIKEALSLEYSVKNYLHITDSMLLAEKIQSKQQNMFWMTGDIDAYTPEHTRMCNEKVIRCVPMKRETLNDLRIAVSDAPDMGQKYKTQLSACFQKIFANPMFKSPEQLTWISDVAVRLPKRMTATFHKLSKVYQDKYEEYDFIIYLLMECLELSVEYLEHNTGTGESRGTAVDYIYPFVFNEIPSKESTKLIFCDQFHKYK